MSERPTTPHITGRSDLMSRRTITALAAAGIGVPLLAACGADDTATDAGGATPASSDTGSDTGSDTASGSASESAGPAGTADSLTSTADIEVGGGTVFADAEVVVTQPTEGEFKCFTSICTHTGCPVGSVEDGTINCPCHGSKFSIVDGSVKDGPAPEPLAEKSITVTGDQIVLA